MKISRYFKRLFFVIAPIGLFCCIADDDFSTPDVTIIEPELDGPEININAVAGQLAQEQGNINLDYSNDQTVYTYNLVSSPQYLVGYVISTDEGGNFFEEIILQDKPENPTIGIKLLIDVNPLFGRYEPGRKIYIKLNGLSVGITNGVLTIGVLNGNQVDKLPAALEEEFIQRSTEVSNLVATPLSIEDFSDDKTNLFIELQEVQFNRLFVLGERPFTYASEAIDEFDGERILESCTAPVSVIFSTSTFADFKNLNLPSGKGKLNAILTKNFFGEVFNVVINSPEDVQLDALEERCDPDFLICEGESGGGQVIYNEDFEDFAGFENEDWINLNISEGETIWGIGSFSSNRYAEISGFNSGEDKIEVWLISPEFDMDLTVEETLSFDIQTNFYNANILAIYVSSDFEENPLNATWQPLDAIIPNGPSGGFGNFETVGPINISCLEGTVRFGFLYQGSDPSATTRYHLDNLRVTGN